MNIASTLLSAAKEHASKPAISKGLQNYCTYGELAERVATIASHMIHSLGLNPGDRVGIAMKNCPEFIEMIYATWYAGCSAVPINAKLHRREFEYILSHSEARVCFITPELKESITSNQASGGLLENVIDINSTDYISFYEGDQFPMAEVSTGDLAWLFYTSGTTGRPKGAMLSHRNLLAMTLGYFSGVDTISPGDVIIHAAPMSHGSGLYGLPHTAKGANHVIPNGDNFQPAEIFSLIQNYPNTTFFAAPTMVKRLVEYASQTSANSKNLKTIVYGGGPMYVEDLKTAIRTLGQKFAQIYGQGESPMTITSLTKDQHSDKNDPKLEEHLSSAGTPQIGIEVKVVDENDQVLGPNQIGEVIVRGETVMSGYFNNPEASAQTLRGGWLHTGDLGYLDEIGYLTLKDRSNDMIISGGTNIYPREVEDILLLHEGVQEVAVISKPDSDWGESVVAIIVAKPGEDVSSGTLDAFCLENMTRFKRPKEYYFTDALPKNNYGKVVKTDLRERLQQGNFDS